MIHVHQGPLHSVAFCGIETKLLCSSSGTRQLCSRRALLMDVRMHRAFAQGTIPGAVNHPLYQPIAGWSLPANMRRAGFAFFGMYGTERNPSWLQEVQRAVPTGAVRLCLPARSATAITTQVSQSTALHMLPCSMARIISWETCVAAVSLCIALQPTSGPASLGCSISLSQSLLIMTSCTSSAAVPADTEIIVACGMGGSLDAKAGAESGFASQSLKAAYFLKQAGFNNVVYMKVCCWCSSCCCICMVLYMVHQQAVKSCCHKLCLQVGLSRLYNVWTTYCTLPGLVRHSCNGLRRLALPDHLLHGCAQHRISACRVVCQSISGLWVIWKYQSVMLQAQTRRAVLPYSLNGVSKLSRPMP